MNRRFLIHQARGLLKAVSSLRSATAVQMDRRAFCTAPAERSGDGAFERRGRFEFGASPRESSFEKFSLRPSRLCGAKAFPPLSALSAPLR